MGTLSKLAHLSLRAAAFSFAKAPGAVEHQLFHRSWSSNSVVLQQCQHWARRAGCQPVWSAISRRYSLQPAYSTPYMHLIEEWARIERRLTCMWNGLTLSNAGQKILITVLPVALVSQLFPGRFHGHALEIANNSRVQPRPVDLLALNPRASVMHRLLDESGLSAVFVRIYEEILICCRALYLAVLFTPAIASAPVATWAGGATREAWLELMTWTLEHAGPAFIKWGQWAATRPDLFPPDLCAAMERLQTAAPTHSAAFSRARIRQSLGQPVAVLFDFFEDEPVASGSIAQVHRATLSAAGAAQIRRGRYAAGATVAVKVRHPGVARLMQHDFILMERAARLASAFPGLSQLRLEESIRQFGGPLREQLDLAVEAKHLSRFKHNFRLWPNVSFPTPLYPYVSADVLVETFENGALISKYVNEPTYAHRETLAETGLKTYLQMLLRDNFIHADLHPGNILVKDAEPAQRAAAGDGWLGWLRRQWPRGPPQLVLLDTGMIAELSSNDQHSLIAFFKALTKQDGESLGRAILNMSERCTCKNPDAFVDAIKQMFENLDAEFIHKNTAMVIENVIDTIREHQVTLRSAVSTVVVTTLVLEGWSTKLNPELRILDTMRDMLMVDFNERLCRTVDRIMSHESLAVVA